MATTELTMQLLVMKLKSVIGEAEPIILPLSKQISFSEAFRMNVQKHPASEELTAEESMLISARNCLGSFNLKEESTRRHFTLVPVKGNILTVSATVTCHFSLLSVFSRGLTREGREI